MSLYDQLDPTHRYSKDISVPINHANLHRGNAQVLLHYAALAWQGDITRLNSFQLMWALSHLPTPVQILCTERFHDMKDTPHSVPPDVMARLTQSLDALNTALLAKDPQMPIHLRESHRVLVAYPETVHLLDDTEIARLIHGAVVHTNTAIVKEKLSPTKKAASKVTVDDL